MGALGHQTNGKPSRKCVFLPDLSCRAVGDARQLGRQSCRLCLGVGWFWGGWEGDRGWFTARIGLCAPRERRGCWWVWGTVSSHWDLAGIAKGSALSISSLPCWGHRGPGDAQTGAVTSCFHQLPAPEPIRACLSCQEGPSPISSLLPAPGWSWMWSHAPKNKNLQHQGTLSSSVPCHGWGHCAPLPQNIPSLQVNVAIPTHLSP